MRNPLRSLSFVLVFMAQPALAGSPLVDLGSGNPLDVTEFFKTRTSDYQLGSEWGKRPVTPEVLASASAAFQRAAKAAAIVGGATGFYLGEFAGRHVMATNHHVYPSSSNCRGGRVSFPLLGKRFTCASYLGTWTDVDLTLFTINVSSESDASVIGAVAENFDFESSIRPGQMLVTVGFGVAQNSLRRPMGNEDSDCKVFSHQDDFRFMADPDDVNPGPYKAWSFANGCDVSHGDSGSAMVDRETGRVVGLIWTGRIPKARQVQDSRYLDTLVGSDHAHVWSELSYAVPAAKIAERLRAEIANPATSAEARSIFESLIAPH